MRSTGAPRRLDEEDEDEKSSFAAPAPAPAAVVEEEFESGHFRTWSDPLNPRLELERTAVSASRRGGLVGSAGRGGRPGPEEGEALTTCCAFFFFGNREVEVETESETAA